MGYDALLVGEFTIEPALTDEECRAFRDLITQNQLTAPRTRCHWIPNAAGSALNWDGDTTFDRSADWLRFLVKHFFKPSGHVLNGKAQARGVDGACSSLSVRNNGVSARYVSGPVAEEYCFVIGPRTYRPAYSRYEKDYECLDCGSKDPHGYDYDHGYSSDDRDYRREYDAAFDLDPEETSRFDGDRNGQLLAVTEFCASYDGLDLTQGMELPSGRVDAEIFADSAREVVLELRKGGVMVISLRTSHSKPLLESRFDAVLTFAVALATELNWIVWDPGQRLAVRPGIGFRNRAIANLESGFEPQYPFRSRREPRKTARSRWDGSAPYDGSYASGF